MTPPSRNGQAEDPGTRKIAVSHVQFARAVDILRKNKQTFLDARPTAQDAADMIGKLCGYPIALTCVADLKAAAGVTWQARRVNGENGTGKPNAVATLAKALHLLFTKLDEEPPAALTDLVDRLKEPAATPT